MKILNQISSFINQGVENLLFGMGISMAIIVAVQVFFRYVLNNSLFWSEELARFLLVWLTFLGSCAAYYRKAHPGIDIVSSRLPAIWQQITAILVHLISIILFGVMIFYGCCFAYFVRAQISPALCLPKWIVFSIIPISGTILTFHAITFLAGELKGNSHDS